MRRKRAQKITNTNFVSGDPRRREPGPNSIKRDGVNWKARWHRTLRYPESLWKSMVDTRGLGQRLTDLFPNGMVLTPNSVEPAKLK